VRVMKRDIGGLTLATWLMKRLILGCRKREPVHSQNSNSNVLMMESLENRHCDDGTDGMCASAVGRVFV